MSHLPLEEKRNKLILALYELYRTTGSPVVKTEQLRSLADVDPDFYSILREVGKNGRRWLEHRNLNTVIKSEGIIKAE